MLIAYTTRTKPSISIFKDDAPPLLEQLSAAIEANEYVISASLS